MSEPRVISASITPSNPKRLVFCSTVHATFDDGTEKNIIEFYEDEIQFTPSEFIGLTHRECLALFHRKDIAYLRS